MSPSKDQLQVLSEQLQRLQDFEEFPIVAKEAHKLSREYAKRLHGILIGDDERYNGFVEYYDRTINGLELKVKKSQSETANHNDGDEKDEQR